MDAGGGSRKAGPPAVVGLLNPRALASDSTEAQNVLCLSGRNFVRRFKHLPLASLVVRTQPIVEGSLAVGDTLWVVFFIILLEIIIFNMPKSYSLSNCLRDILPPDPAHGGMQVPR